MDGELFLHPDVADAIRKRLDDGLIRHLGDLEANVVEALDMKEICPRGNNKVIIYFLIIMINVYYSC